MKTPKATGNNPKILKWDMRMQDLPLKIHCSIDDEVEEVAKNIRNYLGIAIEEQFKWKKDEYTSLNNWKSILEQMEGIV